MTAPKAFLFDRGSKFLVSGAEDTNIKVWDMRNTISRTSLTTFKDHDGVITSFGISGDSRLLFSGAEDGMMKIWDMT